jgi:bifunctional ADP-heptose synthase (sugar kinase/adenylyltransferase)
VYGKGIAKAQMFQGAAGFLRRARVEGLPVVVVSHKTEYGHYDQARVNLRESAREWMQERGFFAANGYGIPAKLREVAQATNVVVTLGFEGLLVHASMEGEYRTDRLPAFNTAPKDVVGAGDSLFTCASLALCAGDAWQGVYPAAKCRASATSRSMPWKFIAEIDRVDYE